MVRIFIQGLADGTYEIDLSPQTEEVPELSEEFFGEITISGKMRILGNVIAVKAEAKCQAKLICDLSAEEFNEELTARLEFTARRADNSYSEDPENDESTEAEITLGAEDKNIDISGALREELALAMPMKRVAPKLRGKSFEDVYPEYSGKGLIKKDEEEIDERWAALKKIKIN